MPPTSKLAVAAFVLALASFLFFLTWLPAIVLGHIALAQIHRSQGRLTGRGYAVAGLAISYLFVVISAIFLVFMGVSVLGGLKLDVSSETSHVQVATPEPEVEGELAATQDLSRARTLSMAIVAYSKDHGGMTPPDFDALYPKYVQDRMVLGEGVPGGHGTGFDYLSPNQKFAELDPDKALLLGKTESANHKKVFISNDDRAGFEPDFTNEPEPDGSPSPTGSASPASE